MARRGASVRENRGCEQTNAPKERYDDFGLVPRTFTIIYGAGERGWSLTTAVCFIAYNYKHLWCGYVYPPGAVDSWKLPRCIVEHPVHGSYMNIRHLM